MQKRNIWIVIGLVIIIAVIAGTYGISHKSSKTTTSASNSSSSSKPTAQSPSSTTSASIIQTKDNASVGQYLADSNGSALYTYGSDTSGVSNCSGSCLYNWPIYQVNSSSASLPTNVTVIKRSDGTSQYAYKGMPLYAFTGDASGQVNGDGVSNFHVAKP